MPSPNIPPESVSLASLASTTQGSLIVSDTLERSGSYTAFIFLEDTVFTSLVGNLEGWEGFTFPSGLVVTGEFSSFQLQSGTLLAYRGFDS